MKKIIYLIIAVMLLTSCGVVENSVISPIIEQEEEIINIIDENAKEYILNNNSLKIHRLDCFSAEPIAPHNKEYVVESIEKLIDKGYSACKNCCPR